MKLTKELEADYVRLWKTCSLRVGTPERAAPICRAIVEHAAVYKRIVQGSSLPWYFVGCLHHMETGGSFEKHLHNGDSLKHRTVQVPRGRPVHGTPPFTFEDSARDALNMHDLLRTDVFTPTMLMYEAERYNGFGYRLHNPQVLSPYLWAGTNHYTQGKYTADGKFDPRAVSKQIGVCALLLCMSQHGTDVAPTAQALPARIVYSQAYNKDVEALQTFLNLRFSCDLKVDGIAGNATSDAFQTVFGVRLLNDPRNI